MNKNETMKRWTTEDIATLGIMRDEGKTCKEIAKKLGRSESSIKNYVHMLKNNGRQPDDIKEETPCCDEPALTKKKNLDDFTPREMIKYLYNLGYRIIDGRSVPRAADARQPGGRYLQLAMTESKAREIMSAALRTFGGRAQTDVCIEEMAELAVAIEHERRGRCSRGAVIEEIADVMIMAGQMAMLYGEDAVHEVLESKLLRLDRRIKEAKEK